MTETNFNYVRVINADERHKGPFDGSRLTVQTPTGGSVLMHAFGMPLVMLGYYRKRPANAAKLAATGGVHDGLRVEILYAFGDHAMAYKILEASKPAREYVLSLTCEGWNDSNPALLQELQAATRAIAATVECRSVLEELGIVL